jgi:hypothetical protein
MSKDWKFGEIDGATERLNPPLEHLEQLNDYRFQLSATETTTYVRINLLCKQVVVSISRDGPRLPHLIDGKIRVKASSTNRTGKVANRRFEFFIDSDLDCSDIPQ